MLVYNPPKTDKFYFKEHFEHILDTISAKNDRVIICGDFNIDILKTNNLSSKYIDSIEGNSFDQVIKQPTRIGNTCDTLWDHIIVKDVEVKNAYTLEDQTFSDHLPIILELITTTSHMQSSNSYRDTTFLKSKTQIEKFNFALMHELQKINWFENTSSINDLFEDYQSRYDLILNKYAPLRISKTTKQNVECPWMCNHIKNLISKRNRLHRAWSRNKNNVRARFRFESARSKVEIEIKKSIKSFTVISSKIVLVTEGKYTNY